MTIFHRVSCVPVNSCILLSTREDALNHTVGEIALGLCPDCGFISNTKFDQKLIEYSDRYEETQGFSPTFRTFHRELAQKLVEKYSLYNKTIIEIGCGKGEFLSLLCELGGNSGIGFDPGYIEKRNKSEAKERIQFIVDFYSEKYASYQGDLIVCKMTLEHIHQANSFIGMTRKSIGKRSDTVIFFQVPDTFRILRDCAFEDIYYEHCSYFTSNSLVRLFQRNDFQILNISTEYDGQYLTIEARPGSDKTSSGFSVEDSLEAIKSLVTSFAEKCREKRRFWDDQLRQYSERGEKVVLWGSGSKAVSFLTTSSESSAIEYVVDINPHRTGYFMPGTGQEIVDPNFVTGFQPDVVIVMNRIYQEEIRVDLNNRGLTPLLITL